MSHGEVTAATDLIDVRLTAVRYAARDTNLYELTRVDGAKLPPTTVGCHIDFNLPNGLSRQYSLVTAGGDTSSYVVGVKRDENSRGGSRYIHDELKVGTLLTISAPRNNFPLDETAAHTVLIAGGIGITPIWSMAKRLMDLKLSWELYYSTRSRVDAAFFDELSKLPQAHLHFDDEAAGKFLDIAKISDHAVPESHLYCCGPVPMLHAFEAATASRPKSQVHIEYFSAKEEAATEGGFTIELKRTGKSFMVPPGKTILDVVRDAGVDVASSCEEGVCGACETTVLSGIPDHRDAILSEAERRENKTMMICCSGAKTDLVLDL